MISPRPHGVRPDLAREDRCGFPEVVFGAGKSRQELIEAACAIFARHGRLLITRLDPAHAAPLVAEIPGAIHHERARCLTAHITRPEARGCVALLCAGTSDLAVAEEARVTAEATGNHVIPFYDVGVAGLHRLMAIEGELQRARVIIAVAGMEGALPSVVAGLTRRPVIGVPTSIGYGASFGGIAALLAMLNSCANGVCVVNIDNGFGAAMLAARINSLE